MCQQNRSFDILCMLNITIICIGRLKEKYYTDAANEYIKRLSGYCKLEVVELSEQRLSDISSEAQLVTALEKECLAIEKVIPPGTTTVALCIEGREIDSRGLSDFLTDCAGRGASRISFIVGGSNGLHEAFKKNAGFRLSMSKMTFPHNLARVILLEQLYRAFKIAEGGKYHK